MTGSTWQFIPFQSIVINNNRTAGNIPSNVSVKNLLINSSPNVFTFNNTTISLQGTINEAVLASTKDDTPSGDDKPSGSNGGLAGEWTFINVVISGEEEYRSGVRQVGTMRQWLGGP